MYLINSPTTLSFLPNDGTAFLDFCTNTKCTYFFEANQTTEGAKEILVNHLLYFQSELSFCEEARYFRSKGLWILIPPLTKINLYQDLWILHLSHIRGHLHIQKFEDLLFQWSLGPLQYLLTSYFHKDLSVLLSPTTSSISRVSSASVKGPNILDQKVSGF